MVGELCLSGAGLARGYLNKPDLTAEKFVPNPYSETGGERLYRTGDLARYRHDGNIEFLGRLDHQVKIRGFRIETAEVEAALGRHEDVNDAVVVATARPGQEPQLVGYVVAREGSGLNANLLRQFLQTTLPAYSVPGAFVMMPALPLNANGKVDRSALPAPEGGTSTIEYVAPRTPTEEILAQIWADVLSVPRVGIHDNFFELGGHSMLATHLTKRVGDKFNVELPVQILFNNPTISSFQHALTQIISRQDLDRDPGHEAVLAK